MKTITATEFQELKKQKETTLIDVRTPEEYQLEHISGAINFPLDNFEDHKEQLKKYTTVVCYCNTGNSSAQFCKRAEHEGIENIINLAGGMSACKQCVKIKRKGALPIMQQVQIAAGGLVLFGIILAKIFHTYQRHEYFIFLSAFVGAGLVFAGSTGWCGLAKLLVKLPRNRIPEINSQTEIIGEKVRIKQFEDKNLAHYSYVIISNGEALIVDPERDPTKYYTYIKEHNATIVGVLNTHPHADFASGHLEIHQTTGAKIYVGEKVGAEYPHTPLKGKETITFGDAHIVTYFTPGHSPDSISYLVKDAGGKEIGFFTGDRVFIGDVGRADLRESVGNIKAKQEELAGMMYESTRSILPTLDKTVMMLPAHGAGTSCGKGLSKHNMDTLENQLKQNPMLQPMTKKQFINELTIDQPAIPAYFTNSVLLNKQGNESFQKAFENVQSLNTLPNDENIRIIDTRNRELATNYPMSNKSLIISNNNSNFTSMLGTLIRPIESFVLIVEKKNEKEKVIHDVLSIGYEHNLIGIYCIEEQVIYTNIDMEILVNEMNTMILDVRSTSTYNNNPVFPDAVNIPLENLLDEIAHLDKEITYIPYCGGNYKSNIAVSLLKSHGFKTKKLSV